MKLTTAQRDRAVGAMVGLACGDALGAPYEFQPARINGEVVELAGGAGWEPGEWTDDSAMAIAILEVVAAGGNLDSEAGQSAVVERWLRWLESGPKDIGIQTSSVLRAVKGERTAAAAHRAAADYAASTDRAAGNGSLMRTAPVAIAFLNDPDKLWRVAQEISALTHADQSCQEACAIWCMGIRTAVLEGSYDGVRAALDRLEPARREYWSALLAEAEAALPHEFERNGWVVHALQAAWSAIHHTQIPELDPATDQFPCQQAERAIENAVRCGLDTDTVAAITGMLVGARWGVSGLPLQWQLLLHGYPGLSGWDLIRITDAALTFGTTGQVARPVAVMPMQPGWVTDASMEVSQAPGLVLGGQQVLRDAEFDAVVSLSRIGYQESPLPAAQHARVWVMDSEDPDQNLNLHYLFHQVSDLLAEWLQQGKRVLLHCVQAQNRTPSFATAYLLRHHGLDYPTATAAIRQGLPTASPSGYLDQVVRDLAAGANRR